MRAGYFPELGVAEFRSDMPEPQIRYDKDVKIRIRKCGICGSEVHALHGMHPFRIPRSFPAMSLPETWSRLARA